MDKIYINLLYLCGLRATILVVNRSIQNAYLIMGMQNNHELLDFTSIIKSDPEKALEMLYSNYYQNLCEQIYIMIRDHSIAQDLVQEVFYEIWKKRENLNIQISIYAYLKRACRNRTLNYLRDNPIRFEDESHLSEVEDNGFSTDDYISAEELNTKIQKAINSLPDKCGVVFTLSRFEDMSYAEIASEMNISVKTVENQISKALKILRKEIYKKINIG